MVEWKSLLVVDHCQRAIAQGADVDLVEAMRVVRVFRDRHVLDLFERRQPVVLSYCLMPAVVTPSVNRRCKAKKTSIVGSASSVAAARPGPIAWLRPVLLAPGR